MDNQDIINIKLECLLSFIVVKILVQNICDNLKKLVQHKAEGEMMDYSSNMNIISIK
jgi:hypothetical protein